jgi:hypothetical protein
MWPLTCGQNSVETMAAPMTLFVLMAVVTTAMTTPLFDLSNRMAARA